MSFGWDVLSGTALGYTGYKGHKAYQGMKQKAANTAENEYGDKEGDIFAKKN